jgi:phospho-N-acetylmuramoyl-pentapeptide-transferase
MLYHLFDYLEQHYNIPGAQLFGFLSFRAAAAVITSLVVSLIFGRRIIEFLRRKQVGETIRDLGLEGEKQKAGTPTMGGLIILAGIVIPTLLFARLDNIYVLLMLFVTLCLGAIGFVDDYIKVFRKNKRGLAGRFKILGQVIVGATIGLALYLHPDVKVRDFANIYVYETHDGAPVGNPVQAYAAAGLELTGEGVFMETDSTFHSHDIKSAATTIPFLKKNQFDYRALTSWAGPTVQRWLFPIVFIIIITLIITAVSNGANLTDGLDGLATGTSASMVFALLLFAYISGNFILAGYLNIMYIPNSGELVIFAASFIGACIGFLWYNAYPASVFMGDTGSLAIGGIIASFAILIRKELLIPLMCGIFLAESVSVIMQVLWFKYTKRRFGTGRRIFLMAPLHHHFQKKGLAESKIVTRFWIVGIVLAVMSIITLKVR